MKINFKFLYRVLKCFRIANLFDDFHFTRILLQINNDGTFGLVVGPGVCLSVCHVFVHARWRRLWSHATQLSGQSHQQRGCVVGRVLRPLVSPDIKPRTSCRPSSHERIRMTGNLKMKELYNIFSINFSKPFPPYPIALLYERPILDKSCGYF